MVARKDLPPHRRVPGTSPCVRRRLAVDQQLHGVVGNEIARDLDGEIIVVAQPDAGVVAARQTGAAARAGCTRRRIARTSADVVQVFDAGVDGGDVHEHAVGAGVVGGDGAGVLAFGERRRR